VDVLIEQHNPETGAMVGRCSRFAPEVDGEVQVLPGDDGRQARPGSIVPVLITGADIYDLNGQIVGARAMVAAARADA
jgi:ribosomal protein S12 methylthiotransferase